MKWPFFFTAIIIEIIYILLFVLTIRIARFRFWPPPSAYSWQFLFAWLMVGVVGLCALVLGFLDLDSGFLPGFKARLPIAGMFCVIGGCVGGWGNLALGMRGTLGLGNKLIVNGPYRYTRNPQYIGDSFGILGLMLLMNSWMVWIIGILALVLNYLAPFTEEPWLEDQYGDCYREYKQRVPRFIGRNK